MIENIHSYMLCYLLIYVVIYGVVGSYVACYYGEPNICQSAKETMFYPK